MRTTSRHGDHAGNLVGHKSKISTLQDYELATQRIAAFDRAARSDDDDQERDALMDAVTRWDAEHDDPTCWKD